jgi:cytochrome b involved in lipid metabolism
MRDINILMLCFFLFLRGFLFRLGKAFSQCTTRNETQNKRGETFQRSMSVRDQTHQHRWQRRVKDWLIVPHSAYANAHDVTLAELQSHNTRGDCWLCVHGVVYDVSRFMPYHPGGTKIIEQYAGRDCTPAYMRNHLKLDPEDVVANCRVGLLIAADDGRGEAPPQYVDRRAPLQSSGSFERLPEPSSPAAASAGGPSLAVLAAQSGLYDNVPAQELEAAALAVDSKKDDVTEAAALEALFAAMDPGRTGFVRRAAVAQLLERIGELGSEGDEVLSSCPDPVTLEQFVAIVQTL